MKKLAKHVGIIALLAIIVLGVVGCNLGRVYDYILTIKNESSVSVYVSAEIYSRKVGPDWSGNITAGTSKTVSEAFSSESANPAYSVRYTVGEKSDYKNGTINEDSKEGTVTITQGDVDNLR